MRDYNEVQFNIDEENVTLLFYVEVTKEIALLCNESEAVEIENMMTGEIDFKYYIPEYLQFDLDKTKEVISILLDSVIKRQDLKRERLKKLMGF